MGEPNWKKIAKGSVALGQKKGAKAIILDEFALGDFLGERALLTGQPRSVSVIAASPTVLMPISKDLFLERVKEKPELALSIVQVLILRLRGTLKALT